MASPQIHKHVFVVVDRERLEPNLAHDGLSCVLEGLTAEEDDVATRQTIIFALVELVTIFARRENNMAGRKKEHPIAFAAFAEVKTTGAFELRGGFGSDWDTKCRSKWVSYISKWVQWIKKRYCI